MMLVSIALAASVAVAPPYGRHAQPMAPIRARLLTTPLAGRLTAPPMYVFRGFVVRLPSVRFFSIALRNGQVMRVDSSIALARGQNSGNFFIGRPLAVIGYLDALGVMHASTIERTEDAVREWPPDGRFTPVVIRR